MALHPQGVLFGPVKNWGQGSMKLVLEIDRDGETKTRRQVVLKNVAN